MTAVDARFYAAVPPRSLGEKLLRVARDRIYRDFIAHCAPAPGDTILDVGVSDVITDGANLLERLYPHPVDITAVGLGEGTAFRAAFPQVRYNQIIAGERLPFQDGAFDIAVSNAVIEHVGGPTQQAAFVAELARVAKRVFITAPNRWFPVEHHTAVPLLHYNRKTFELACKTLGRAQWLAPENLTLTGPADLRAAVPRARTARVGYTGLPLGPFSSNLYLSL